MACGKTIRRRCTIITATLLRVPASTLYKSKEMQYFKCSLENIHDKILGSVEPFKISIPIFNPSMNEK